MLNGTYFQFPTSCLKCSSYRLSCRAAKISSFKTATGARPCSQPTVCDRGGFSLNFNPQFNPGCCFALMKSASPPPPPPAARRRYLTARPGGDGGRWAQKMSEEMSSRGPRPGPSTRRGAREATPVQGQQEEVMSFYTTISK